MYDADMAAVRRLEVKICCEIYCGRIWNWEADITWVIYSYYSIHLCYDVACMNGGTLYCISEFLN
jgi:hypothetical protein